MYEAKLIPLPLESNLPQHTPSMFRNGHAATHRVLPKTNINKDKSMRGAREIEKSQSHAMRLNTEDPNLHSPEKKTNLVYGIGSGKQTTSQWTMPIVQSLDSNPAFNQPQGSMTNFRIPQYVGHTSKKKIVKNDMAKEMVESPSMAAVQKTDSTSQVSSSVAARLKTKAIISDINKMKQMREVLSSQQSNFRANEKRDGLQTERQSKNDDNQINYSVQKRKILALVQQQKKDNMIDRKNQRQGGFKALAPIPSKLLPVNPKKLKNLQQAAGPSIENIMQTRKEQKESDQTIQMLGVIDRDVRNSQLLSMRTSGGFNYERQSEVQPKQHLVGISRTASTNQFTSRMSQNQRKLSMQPPLVQNRSMGKLTPLI